MRIPMLMKAIPLALVVAACTREAPETADDALSRDLALAAQPSPYGPQPYASPQELGYGQPYAPQYGQYGAYPQPYPQPQYYPQVRPVQTVYQPAPAPAPRVVYRTQPAPVQQEPIRHTKRDAMIGAATGAIAGAAIGRDVKGAVIGAAAGGVLGAIVGHTIDVEKP